MSSDSHPRCAATSRIAAWGACLLVASPIAVPMLAGAGIADWASGPAGSSSQLTVSTFHSGTSVPTLTGLEGSHSVPALSRRTSDDEGESRFRSLAIDEPWRLASLEMAALQRARKDVSLDLADTGRRVIRSLGQALSAPEVALGLIELLPNQSGQWVDLKVSNPGTGALELLGVNLHLQVADSGPASEGGFGTINGPNITAVDLVTGTLFASNNRGGTASAPASAQAGLWTVVTDSGSVLLPGGATVTLARVQFDTIGVSPDRAYPLILALDVPSEGISAASTFVGVGGALTTIQYSVGTVVVPEPAWTTVGVGLGLGAVALVRRRRPAFSARG